MVKNYCLEGVWLSFLASAAMAENLVPESKTTDMNVTIYQNQALVKDIRNVDFAQGMNEIAFEGVARQIRPETAMFSASGIRVFEQNYDYDLINAQNLLEEAIGKKVKTAEINPANGETIIKDAVLINNNYGSPVLKFDYGIEANFPGRVVFEQIPQNLRVKPTLMAKLDSREAGTRPLELDYLANGLSWQADYVAEIDADDKLRLNSWVTLNNESGADYKNAKIRLVAGSVNQVADVMPRMRNKAIPMLAAGLASDEAVAETSSMQVMPVGLDGYYLYTLPERADILDKQSKQVSLFSKENVKFEKEYKLVSPLYLSYRGGSKQFENMNPDVVYKLVNLEENNLGLPLPAGTVRFYRQDQTNGLQFIGESRMAQTAVGGKSELKIGKSFDISVEGKVVQVKEISDKIRESDVEIKFANGSDKNAVVEFVQNGSDTMEILKENLPHDVKNAYSNSWKIGVPAKGEAKLTFTVRMISK